MKQSNSEIYNRACQLYAAIEKNCEIQSLISEFNHLVDEYDFDNVITSSPEGKVGLELCNGETAIPALYDRFKIASRTGIPRENVWAIGVRDNIEVLIDHKGREIFTADEIKLENNCFGSNLAYRIGSKWGMASHDGKNIIIAPVMDKIEWGGNGYTFFMQCGKYGIRTPFGEIISPQFEEVGWDADDYLVVTFNGVKGYIDESHRFTTNKAERYFHFHIAI